MIAWQKKYGEVTTDSDGNRWINAGRLEGPSHTVAFWVIVIGMVSVLGLIAIILVNK